MPETSNASSCDVFVFRHGAFSAMGHDLALRVTRFSVEIGEELAIEASFDTGSLRVAGVKPEVVVEIAVELPPAARAESGETRS